MSADNKLLMEGNNRGVWLISGDSMKQAGLGGGSFSDLSQRGLWKEDWRQKDCPDSHVEDKKANQLGAVRNLL